jgi:hypothetical protein
MGLQDLPTYYLIMHQFIYQVEASLRAGSQAAWSGRTKKVTARLRELGWERMDYLGRETKDGKPRINVDSVWAHPDHWANDPEMRPPVDPKSDEAEDFMRKIMRGSRLHYPPEVKEEIMDAIISEATDGKTEHWYGPNIRGQQRRQQHSADRLDQEPTANTTAAFPQGVDPWILIPQVSVTSLANKRVAEDKYALDKAERGLPSLGLELMEVPALGKNRGVWYSPQHWEPIAGDAGLTPKSDEAEDYDSRLDHSSNSPAARFLPDPSYLIEVEKVVMAAIAAGAKGRGPAAHTAPTPSKEEPAAQAAPAGKITVDKAAWSAMVDGKDVGLKPLEFKLLYILMSRKGRVQTRQNLLEEIWGDGSGVDTRVVDLTVSRLRTKLGEAGVHIRTDRAADGYVYDPVDPNERQHGQGTAGGGAQTSGFGRRGRPPKPKATHTSDGEEVSLDTIDQATAEREKQDKKDMSVPGGVGGRRHMRKASEPKKKADAPSDFFSDDDEDDGDFF